MSISLKEGEIHKIITEIRLIHGIEQGRAGN
jgi:hypothetical protein